jgi:hypothetical protein
MDPYLSISAHPFPKPSVSKPDILDQNEDRQVKTVPCTILAVLSATETILLQNYHEQFPPFPIHTNPPYDLISLSIVYHMLFY